jgi:hypothetical protein
MSSSSPTTDLPAAAARRPRRWRIVLTRAAFVLAVLITLIIGWYIVVRIRGDAAWQTYQADARARGVKLALADHVPPPIPDDRNYAAIPLFLNAFKIPVPSEPLTLLSDDAPQQPPLGSWIKGEAIDLQKWQAYFVGKKMLPAPDDSPAADVLKALDRFAPELKQLRAVEQRADARFPVDYADGIGTRLPHLRILQSVARFYVLRLTAHLGMGDSPAAYEDFRGALRVTDALKNEPMLISGLVRLSNLAITENVIAGGLMRHQWSDAELAKIIADLSHERLMDDFAAGIGGERAVDNLVHEQFLGPQSRDITEALFGDHGFSPLPRNSGDRLWLNLLPRLYPRGWVRLNQTKLNEYFDAMLASATQDPPRVFLDRPVSKFLPPPSARGFFRRTREMFFLLLAPSLENILQRYAYGQTSLDEARLACALERYRLAHGTYPDSLDALAGDYLPSIPHDVMNGEPLHYRLEPADGFTIYSVGWNLHDDGGTYAKQKSASQQPDWVWTVRPN